MPQAKRLITASLTGDRNIIRKAIDDVNYHMKRNYVAYKSHRQVSPKKEIVNARSIDVLLMKLSKNQKLFAVVLDRFN